MAKVRLLLASYLLQRSIAIVLLSGWNWKGHLHSCTIQKWTLIVEHICIITLESYWASKQSVELRINEPNKTYKGRTRVGINWSFQVLTFVCLSIYSSEWQVAQDCSENERKHWCSIGFGAKKKNVVNTKQGYKNANEYVVHLQSVASELALLCKNGGAF